MDDLNVMIPPYLLPLSAFLQIIIWNQVSSKVLHKLQTISFTRELVLSIGFLPRVPRVNLSEATFRLSLQKSQTNPSLF